MPAVSDSKITQVIRLGLGDPTKIAWYRRILSNPVAAMNQPLYRRGEAEVLEHLLHLVLNDQQIYNRLVAVLRRENPSEGDVEFNEEELTEVSPGSGSYMVKDSHKRAIHDKPVGYLTAHNLAKDHRNATNQKAYVYKMGTSDELVNTFHPTSLKELRCVATRLLAGGKP